MTKRARGGFTLVEVMLAGAIAVLMTLALMEGLVVSAKISHENAELLAADAFAWDTAWKWLNKAYDELPSQTGGVVYDSATDTAMSITTNDCPELAAAKTGGDPRVVVRVVMCGGGSALSRHGKTVSAKRIDVDVEWGPDGDRKCLNGLCGDSVANYCHTVSVYKCSVDRGTLE
ncbi:MAG: hypothetical protein IKE55_09010 [Kiritimatiellae bacterium]|nr:hypothetical protein [Kiritimatiellia bacterium]